MAKTARKKSSPEAPTTEIVPPSETSARPTEEEIATRAYHIYLERGGEGNPDDDWLQAERELTERSDPQAGE
jgi:hypothetical protein